MLPEKQSSIPHLQAYARTDIGKHRQQNEDRHMFDLSHALFIVADGMGGQQAGEIAAEAITTVLPPMLIQRTAGNQSATLRQVAEIVQETLLDLSQRLWNEGRERSLLQGMGSTIVLVWVFGQQALLAHMGDSRVYLLRQGHLSHLTEDHSVLATLLRNNAITPEDARSHPARGKLSRYVGMEDKVGPEIQLVQLYESDRLLLCTDGLTNMVSDETIEKLLLRNPKAEAACTELVQCANDAGGTDNITVMIIDYDNIRLTGSAEKKTTNKWHKNILTPVLQDDRAV